MGELRTSTASTTTALTSLASQVAALTDIVAWLLQSLAPEPNPAPPPDPPVTTPLLVSEGLPLDPWWEPNLPSPKPYNGEVDRSRGFLGQCKLLFRHQPSRYRLDRARVALIMSSVTDQALNWAIAAVDHNPQFSTNLQLFTEEFKRMFDHPTNRADAAGRLHSIQQGSQVIAEYTLDFRTLAADSGWDDTALRSAYRHGLAE